MNAYVHGKCAFSYILLSHNTELVLSAIVLIFKSLAAVFRTQTRPSMILS